MADAKRPAKQSIVNLDRFMEKEIRVKFNGGREVVGTLKGWDQLLNLVLDNTTEYLRDPDDVYKVSDATRQLGLVVCRGTQVVVVMPTDGMDEIANPFIQEE
mmetsp:Transcript_20603/g.53573  ORF Transcript_20603/g.53573 Transcript_20603/m.53573 type:complete len:102 (+) Transcript_20603:115-420(+)